MKHVAPQTELGFPQEPMKLVTQSTTDGDRVQSETARQKQHREESDRAQFWIRQMRTAVERAPEWTPPPRGKR